MQSFTLHTWRSVDDSHGKCHHIIGSAKPATVRNIKQWKIGNTTRIIISLSLRGCFQYTIFSTEVHALSGSVKKLEMTIHTENATRNRDIVTSQSFSHITVRNPLLPLLTCLASRYEKSIKRWSHVRQSPQETDGAKMLDYIAAGDVRSEGRVGATQKFIKTMNPNHMNKSMTHALAVGQFRLGLLIWIMVDASFKDVCILWAMARGNCNLVWLKISPDTTCLINNLILPPPARAVYQMVANRNRNWRLINWWR